MTEILDFVYDNTFWFLLAAVVSWLAVVVSTAIVTAFAKSGNLLGCLFFVVVLFSAASMWVSWICFLIGIAIHLIVFAQGKVG